MKNILSICKNLKLKDYLKNYKLQLGRLDKVDNMPKEDQLDKEGIIHTNMEEILIHRIVTLVIFQQILQASIHSIQGKINPSILTSFNLQLNLPLNLLHNFSHLKVRLMLDLML